MNRAWSENTYCKDKDDSIGIHVEFWKKANMLGISLEEPKVEN